MKIVFASDHAGFELKKELAAFVRNEFQHEVEDVGAHEFNETDDYPDFIAVAAKRVSEDSENCRAVILGGSGQGEAMVANRFAHIRAAVYYGGAEEIVRLAREHNDANILSLGARFFTPEEAKEAVRIFLTTEFSGEERHTRRVAKIEKLGHPIS